MGASKFDRRRRRLGLTVVEAAAWLREPVGTVKNWNQGRRRPPRSAMRLLAVLRWLRWGEH